MQNHDFVETGAAEPGNPGARRPDAVSGKHVVPAHGHNEAGCRLWIIPGGHIPLLSSGPEPAFTSHDKLSLLNLESQHASIRITVYLEDADPVGPFQLTVPPKRILQTRLNDFIFPTALMLATPYALLIQSDKPVIVQFSRMDTSNRSTAVMGTLAYSSPDDMA